MEVKHEGIGKEPIADRLIGKESTRVEGISEGRQTRNEPTGSVRDIVAGTGIPDTGVVEQPGHSINIDRNVGEPERGREGGGIRAGIPGIKGVRPEGVHGRVPRPYNRLASENIQDPYIPQSKGVSGGNLIPKNLAEPIAKILQKIENVYGAMMLRDFQMILCLF